MGPRETAQAASLACQVFDRFVAPHFSPDGVAEFHRYASAAAFSERNKSGHVTLLAKDGGKLIGMLHLRRPRHVAMLFILPSFQRRGVSGGLLAAAGALVGEPDAEFTVNSSPNAISAYKRFGFQATDAEQCVNGIRFVPMKRQKPDAGIKQDARDAAHERPSSGPLGESSGIQRTQPESDAAVDNGTGRS